MKATIVYIIDPDANEVLMAKKKKKVGVGFWFGYGGKVEEGETAVECACRETFQESGDIITLDPEKLEPVAHISFFNKENTNPLVDEPSFEVLAYRIFVSKESIGTPVSTDEMDDPTWFSILDLPWHEIKPGDELILPQVLLGGKIKGFIQFSPDSKQVIAASLLPCPESSLTL